MALIENLNYVESTIINDIPDIPSLSNTANATLIFGTARKGKTGVLKKVGYSDVVDIHGPAPSPDAKDFDTDLTHAVVAIQAATVNRDKDIYTYKVGDSVKARLSLYEMQITTSGDYSYTLDSTNNPIKSLIVESLNENDEANNTRVIVSGDDSTHEPTAVTFEMPDGYRRVFSIDVYGVRPGIASNVKELVDQIRQDGNITNQITIDYTKLSRTNHSEIVLNGEHPYIDIDAVGINESWGDKLLSIEKIFENLTYTETVEAGKTSNTLKYLPIKDTLATTVTISSFTKIVDNEIIKTATAANIGATTITKSLLLSSTGMSWDQNPLSFVPSRLEHKRGSTVTTLTSYTFNNGTIDIDLSVDSIVLAVGDVVTIDYTFGAALTEANVKSDLIVGNENSYFIAGKNILFGAAPSLDLEVTYDAINEFVASDINRKDDQDIIIEFINPNNQPLIGNTVYIDYTHLPEFPAISGSVISGGTTTYVQNSSLIGGTSGNNISKQRYKELVEEGLNESMLIPFSKVIVAGAFLDDIVDGIDEETGLPGQVNLNWSALLSTKLEYKSQVARECNTVLGVKPLTLSEVNEGLPRINQWQDYLLNDFDDPYSAATAMAAMNSYHIDVAVGVGLFSDPQLIGGAQFIDNPAYIEVGMQLDGTLEESMIRQNVPNYLKTLLVTFPSGTIVGKMNGMRYNTLVINPKNQIRIADAATGGIINSSLSRQIVSETVFTAARIARDIAEEDIGFRLENVRLNLMESKINRGMIDVLVPDFCSQIRAEIVPVAGGHITGETKVRLWITTSVEIRRVYFETTVKLGAPDEG